MSDERATIGRNDRVVVSDNNHEITITLYDVPITPRHALRLGAQLIEAGLRGLDREPKS
jgi:hypothetical protein